MRLCRYIFSLSLGWLCERKLNFCFLNWHLETLFTKRIPAVGLWRGCSSADLLESMQQGLCSPRAASTSKQTRSMEKGLLALLVREKDQYLHKGNWENA